jgi:hypothetical protein
MQRACDPGAHESEVRCTLQRPRQAGDRAESHNQITRKQVCSAILMETDISNSFSLQAMPTVCARAIFVAAKLRRADINHAGAYRGEGRALNERLTFLRNR